MHYCFDMNLSQNENEVFSALVLPGGGKASHEGARCFLWWPFPRSACAWLEGSLWLIFLSNWIVIRISPESWGQVNLVPAPWAALAEASLIWLEFLQKQFVGLFHFPSTLLRDTESSLTPFQRPSQENPQICHKVSHLLVIFISNNNASCWLYYHIEM